MNDNASKPQDKLRIINSWAKLLEQIAKVGGVSVLARVEPTEPVLSEEQQKVLLCLEITEIGTLIEICSGYIGTLLNNICLTQRQREKDVLAIKEARTLWTPDTRSCFSNGITVW